MLVETDTGKAKVNFHTQAPVAWNSLDYWNPEGTSGDSSGVKVYRALLTQTGTDAPVATVLENTLGGTVVWSYGGVGTYTATLANAFTANKTHLMAGTPSSPSVGLAFYRGGTDTLGVDTTNGDPSDDILSNNAVQVLVYP